MRGKNILWLSLVALLLSVMMVNVGKAPVTLPKLWVDPARLPSNGVGHPGDAYYVSINIDDVEDLYAVGVTVQFALYGGVLVASDVAQGDFLSQDGNLTAFTYRISVFAGTVKIGISRLGIVPGISGSGTLATMKFTVREAGNSPIELKDIGLIDSTGSKIEPYETVGGIYYGVTAKMSSTTLQAGTLHPSFIEGEEVGVTPTPVVGETVGVETWTYIDHEWVGTGDKVTTTFYLAQAPMVPETEIIWLWKTAQVRDVDYTIDYDTNMVTFMTAPPKGKEIYADYTIWNPTFQLANTPVIAETEHIYVDGTEYDRIRYDINYFTGTFDFLELIPDGSTITADYIPGSLTYPLDNTPVPASETIYVAGVAQERDVDYSIDYVAGTITFLSMPAFSEVITTDYEYLPLTREVIGKVKNEADLPLQVRVRYDNVRVEDGRKTTIWAGQFFSYAIAPPPTVIYVDGFVESYREWNEIGAMPWLDAIEAHMVEGTCPGAYQRWFTFEDLSMVGYGIDKISIEGYTNGPYDEGVDYDVYGYVSATGEFSWLGSLYGTGEGWQWVSPRWIDPSETVDVFLPTATTEEGFNSLMLFLYGYGDCGPGNFIDCVRLHVSFTSKAPKVPPVYTVQPMELFTVDAAIWNLIGLDKGTYVSTATVEYTHLGLAWHEGEKRVTYAWHFGP